MKSKQAQEHCKNGGRIMCAYCGRDKFSRPTPHRCTGGFRKRNLQWVLIGEVTK